MSIYRRIWEEYHQQTIPKGWHIHHIDGDNSNNTIGNLICVSAHVHWCIHFLQGDPIAIRGKFVQGASKAGKRGGKSPPSDKTRQSSKKLMEEINKRNPEGCFKGKKHSEETRKKMRQLAKEGKFGRPKGYKHTPEPREKMKQAALKKNTINQDH